MELPTLALLLVNLAGVAYSYGKLNQKVNDLCNRVARLENHLSHLPMPKGDEGPKQ